MWVIEGNGPWRKKGFQRLNGIVLNERNWGVRNDRHAAGSSWLRIKDFGGEMEKSLPSGSYHGAACLSSLPVRLCPWTQPPRRERKKEECWHTWPYSSLQPDVKYRLSMDQYAPSLGGLWLLGKGGTAAVPAIPCRSWDAAPRRMLCRSLGTRFLPVGDAVSF